MSKNKHELIKNSHLSINPSLKKVNTKLLEQEKMVLMFVCEFKSQNTYNGSRNRCDYLEYVRHVLVYIIEQNIHLSLCKREKHSAKECYFHLPNVV